MNDNRDLERLLDEHYATEGVLRAPDRVLSSALAAIDSTSQRHGIASQLSRIGGLGGYARFAVASLIVVAVTAFVLGVLYAGPGHVGQRPTQRPPSASPTPRPNEEGSGNFVVPFTYVLPEGAEFDYGTRDATYFEIRIPAAWEAGHGAGVIVQAIGGGRVDPCDPESPYLPISPGPQAVIDYLKTVPDMTVADESAASVGDLPAFQARVTAGTETPTCQEIWPWVAATEAFTDIPRQIVVRIVAVDVGEHVVFTVFGEDTNPGWAEMAEELIDSFRFGTPDREELDKFRLETQPLNRSPAAS
jgi:hypothetical protein